MRRWIVGVAVAVAILGTAPARVAPVLAADASHGKQLFQACAACHGQDGKGGQLGPALTGVVGRKAASLDNFRYSNAMQHSNIVWSESSLRAYVVDPQAKVKGNRMPFSGVRNPKDADDIVAYLKTLK
jgi:cytochrome c